MLECDYNHAMQWLGDVKYAYTNAYACDQIIKAGDGLFLMKLLLKDL